MSLPNSEVLTFEDRILLTAFALPLLSLAHHFLEPLLIQYGCATEGAPKEAVSLADVEKFTDADAEEKMALERKAQEPPTVVVAQVVGGENENGGSSDAPA